MPTNPRQSSRVFPAVDGNVLRVVGDVLGRPLYQAARDYLLSSNVDRDVFWMRRGSRGRLFVVFLEERVAVRFANHLVVLGHGVVGFVPV